jgi:hypothetical protein
MKNITADLFRRLQWRNNASGVILLCEVGDGGEVAARGRYGFRNRGWSDAISMQTWPSKGLLVTGYEVKATRPDWLRELDEPEKNATWQKQCHEWYIVAPKDIVKLEELPDDWGLLVPRGADGLRIASRATVKAERGLVPLGLMAAVFRAAGNERRRLEGIARDEIREQEREILEKQIERSDRAAGDYRKKFEELGDALGSHWGNLDRLKERAVAIQSLERSGDDPKKLLAELRQRFERAASQIANIEESL